MCAFMTYTIHETSTLYMSCRYTYIHAHNMFTPSHSKGERDIV